MRGFSTAVGWLMLVAGIGLLIFSGLATNSTASSSNALTAAERSGFWSCQAVDGGRQDCQYAGASPGALQANVSASMGWTQVGVGMTIGGAVLVGAAMLASSGLVRSPQAGQPPVGQPVQQFGLPQQQVAQQYPVPQAGSFAPQPNYGQPT